ncbi:MAG: hypothetical protein JWM97_3044, partial [Phycisphaerales bacterium]|nr:hypothetical protein [Phycisphaerales bacterium]
PGDLGALLDYGEVHRERGAREVRGAEAAAVDGLANVRGKAVWAVAQRAVGAQVLVELAEDRAEPPLVGEHAFGDAEDEFIRVERHSRDCSALFPGRTCAEASA